MIENKLNNNIIKTPPVWKSIDEVRKSTIDYIISRKAGLVKSIRTPWPKLNNAILGGLEWGGMYVIAARPGVGKTATMDQITSCAHILNPEQDFAILKFQFEMSDKMSGARELTSLMKMDLKTLFSAEGSPPLTDDDIRKMSEYRVNKCNDEIYVVEKTRTAQEFRSDVIGFYRTVKKPIIVTLDHSLLIKRSASEKDSLETLYAFAEVIVELKKLIPQVLFIVLTQMNRNIEDPKRRESGKIGNYPTSGDIFGADALMQNCDVTIALNRPDLLGISSYGEQQIVVKPGMIVAHLLKNRYGDQGMIFMKEDLKHFRIVEETESLRQGKKFQ